MRSSCAPYNKCTKKSFLYNPNNPKKSFDVYIDKDPSDTIPIKYTTVSDIENTIRKLEKLYKNGKYPHKRIWQVGMIMKVRLEAIKKHKNTKYPNAKNVTKRFDLANKYFKFLGERTKIESFSKRKKIHLHFSSRYRKYIEFYIFILQIIIFFCIKYSDDENIFFFFFLRSFFFFFFLRSFFSFFYFYFYF